MKKSELIKLIVNTIKEEFAKAPKFGDIDPTAEKDGVRPFMSNRPKDGMDTSQQKKMLWAEGKDLPEDGKISDVKIPFKIVKIPTLQIMDDCTIVKHGKIDELDLNDPYLYATQDHLFLTKDELITHYNSDKNKKLPIVVIFPNGVKLIQDGHHRLSIQKLTNKSKAYVEYRPVHRFEDVEEETEDFIKELGPTINEMNALGVGGVSATSDGSAFGSQKKNHEMMWQEEKLGKSGPNGPTYFQMGASLPTALYNQKDGKSSRDPGIAGLKEKFYHGTTIDLEPGQYILPPNNTGKVSEKGRLKNLDKIFFTQDLGSAKIYAGRAKHSLGGTPKVYLIEPDSNIEVINNTPGSTVFMAPKAKVVKRVL